MCVPKATAKQIGFIHGLCARLDMDEATRRDFLERETGARSCKEITAVQAQQVIDTLKAKSGAGRVAGIDSAIGKKLLALWISGWNLGLVRDRTDRAMLAFVERQCGVSHTRFLREPGAGSGAVEGLKAWLARDGGVEWPDRAATGSDFKRAVLDAQWLKLVALGDVKPFMTSRPLLELDAYAFKVAGTNGWSFFGDQEYDAVTQALGRKLRGALARKDERERAAGMTGDAA